MLETLVLAVPLVLAVAACSGSGAGAPTLLGFATEQIVLPVAVTAEQLHVPFLTSQMPVEAFASGDKSRC